MYFNKIELWLITVPVIIILTNIIVELATVIFAGINNKNDQFRYVKEDAALHDTAVLVDTKYGKIKGRTLYTTYKNVPYYSFTGIPYARPPILDLRYKVNWHTVGLGFDSHLSHEHFSS